MKYIVAFNREKPDSANYNAWSKAPSDVLKTMESVGVIVNPIIVPKFKFKLLSVFWGLVSVVKFYFKLTPEDEVYIQDYNGYMRLLVNLLKKKKVKLHCIVHDVLYFRFGISYTSKLELGYLKKFDVLYVHTNAMKSKLLEIGIAVEMRVMNLFDYYSDDDMHSFEEQISLKNTVCIAGNLDKSIFLRYLSSLSLDGSVKFKLYGVKQKLQMDFNENVEYLGLFLPSKTSVLKAGWGLLWDGERIDTCSGNFGEYLKINSSHKLSLYIACGIPVIAWSQSYIGQWLAAQKIAVLVNSISEIPYIIYQMSESDYEEYVDNTRMLGEELRKGELLKRIL